MLYAKDPMILLYAKMLGRLYVSFVVLFEEVRAYPWY